MHDHFGELRHLVEQLPSPSAFENLVYFIEHRDSPSQRPQIEATWIPYLSDRLESWPDATRLCPKPLLERYESNSAVWGVLVRALDFEQEKLARTRTSRILKAKHMSKITSVDLRSTYIKWPQLVDFASSAPFGKLEHIAFRKGTKGSDLEALGEFFSSKMLAEMSSLSFEGWSNINASVYDVLLEHFPVENLTKIDLSGLKIISARRLKDLLDTGRFANLEEIEFRRHDSMGSKGLFGTICQAKDLKKLRSIRGAWVKGQELITLSRADHLTHLEELHLSDLECTPEELEAALDAENLPALEHLSIGLSAGGKAVDERGKDLMRALGQSKLIRQVKTLSLSSNTHLDLCAFLDAADHELDHLTHFSWRPWCHGDDKLAPVVRDELRALAKTSFTQLIGLNLRFYSMHQAARDHNLCKELLAAPFFPQLQELQVLGQCFHPQDILRLTTDSRFPVLRVCGLESPLDATQWRTFLTQTELSRLEVLRAWFFDPHEVFLDLCALLNEEAHHIPRLARLLVNTALSYHVDKDLLRDSVYLEASQCISLGMEYTFSDGNPTWLTR